MFSKVWLTVWLVCLPGAVFAQGRAPELPPGEGRELAQSVCGTACHDTRVPAEARASTMWIGSTVPPWSCGTPTSTLPVHDAPRLSVAV